MIPSADVKPEEFAKIVEDVEIMARILDKALGHESTDLDLSVLQRAGYLATSFVSDSRLADATTATQGIFLEGFGALFLASVDFPLVPTAENAEPTEESQESVWEQTRRELYGSDNVTRGRRIVGFEHFYRDPAERAKDYDPKQVDQLQKTLLEALKHAANIRALGPDDAVAVTVRGTGVQILKSIPVLEPMEGGEPKEVRVPVSQAAASRPTVLTIRVKKSDVDALAKDELSFDEFRKKATILAY